MKVIKMIGVFFMVIIAFSVVVNNASAESKVTEDKGVMVTSWADISGGGYNYFYNVTNHSGFDISAFNPGWGNSFGGVTAGGHTDTPFTRYSNYGPTTGTWSATLSGGGTASAGAIVAAPEPISSILFITGGTLLAGRRYLRKKKKA